jgi:hypothetical protein
LTAVLRPWIEFDEGVRRPHGLLQFLARDDLAGPPQQYGQNLERLLLELHHAPLFAQFSSAQIGFEQAEADGTLCFRLWLHQAPRWSTRS